LYIRKNKIPELNEICWLRNLPKLKFLWLEENPAAQIAPGKQTSVNVSTKV
jgi:Leucine-rich repeat (LRR) protein